MKSPMAYACYNTNKEIRLSSSSGAIFSSLAECVLKRHGVVYGVTMSEDCYSAEFISVTSREDLAKLRGSKYLQAKATRHKVEDDSWRLNPESFSVIEGKYKKIKPGGINYVWDRWFYRKSTGSTDPVGWSVKTGI